MVLADGLVSWLAVSHVFYFIHFVKRKTSSYMSAGLCYPIGLIPPYSGLVKGIARCKATVQRLEIRVT